ncbi:hypothetical protein [Christiangramia sp. SM2212]|uniref:SGNH/GDSL hydrolase family protein n=1 Tax=Christiangramia sediminicola TaxID=3073267 RepID=A0ABU1ES47_9FLAO|nr:hypothetical protein [Christiangramia sp. SM2212]MDR5590978.1 hypothetical protein [Christiangramia sp. SM2212]
MNLKTSLLIALGLSLAAIVAWEIYWRNQGYFPNLDSDNELWALQRAKIPDRSEEDVVLVGSSRIFFDIQLQTWKDITGRMPVQLAIEGTSPLYTFDDIARNSEFGGTVIVGVTPGLFFSTVFPEAGPHEEALGAIKHFKERTYAQRLNHLISLPIQNNVAFANSYRGTGGSKLQTILNDLKKGGTRIPDPMPPFPNFGQVDHNRNLRMRDIYANDTSEARKIKDVWKFFATSAPRDRKPQIKETTQHFIENAKLIIERGGKVILLRAPSTGWLYAAEEKFLPRNDGWDYLVKASGLPAYHFKDYPQLDQFECPEWSHLSGPQGEVFTREFVEILIADGHIKSLSQSNN